MNYKMNLGKSRKKIKISLKQTLEKFQNSSKSLNNILESQVIDKFKTGLGYDAATTASPAVESFVNLSDKSGSDKGYHSVPPPLTGNFIPRKLDLTFMDEIVESENLDVTTVVTPSNEKTVKNKGVFNTVESNTVKRECCASINKELVSDGKKKTIFPTVSKIEFVGPKKPEKTIRKPVKYAEMYRSQRPRGNQRNWNNQKSQQLGSDFVMYNKACFVCGSFDHLKKDCSKRMVKLVWNNAMRENHQNSTRMTHPNSKRNMIPQAVLMRSGLKTINTARSRAAVNAAKPKAVHNAVKRNRFHDVKASACWVWKPKNRVIDHGRKITEIDQDLDISLVQHDVEIQGRHEHEPEFDFDAANIPVTTTGAEISTASPEVKTVGDSIEDSVVKFMLLSEGVNHKFKGGLLGIKLNALSTAKPKVSTAYKLQLPVLTVVNVRSSSSSDTEVDSCSKSRVKAYAYIKEQYDSLSSDYKKSQFNLVSYKAGQGYDATTAASPAVESFVNLSDKSGSDKRYHSVSPPLTGNFIPRKLNLTFMDEIVESENLDVTTVVTPSNEKTVENKGVFNTVESNTVRRECCALINEELVSDVTTTGAEISTASPEVKTAGDSIEDIAAETLVYIRRSAAKSQKIKVAVRLQAELDKEERQRISRAEGLIQELLQKIFIHAERSRR
ncbi:ribonuclease H-like domain-containing protein [Tanacetum coccineum]